MVGMPDRLNCSGRSDKEERLRELAYERELDSTKIAIKNIINDTNKKGLKGLDALLSTFSRISGTGFNIVGEEYLREEMKGLDYKLKAVEDLASDQRVYKNIDKTKELGIFISAAINNVVKPGEKIYINSPKPIDYLFLRLKDAEGHVNIAGSELGSEAENSKIYAEKAGSFAGEKMRGCEFHVDIAGVSLGVRAVNSKIFAKTAGYEAGRRMVNSEMHIYKAREHLGVDALGSKIYVYEAGNFLGQSARGCKIFAKKAGLGAGNSMKKSKLYVDKAEGWLADYAENSEIHFGEAGDKSAEKIRNCKVYGKKAGDDFGDDAFRSKIYVDELGNNACDGMQDSELHFKKIDGKLGSWSFDMAFLHNKVYKGNLRYLPPNITHALEFTLYLTGRLWYKLKPEPRVNWAGLLLYLGPSNKK